MILENPNGTFTAFFYLTRTKKKQKTFSSRRLAEDWVAVMRLRREREEVHGKENNVLIRDVIDEYKKDVKKAESSNARDSFILERWKTFFKRHSLRYVSDIDKRIVKKYERERMQASGEQGLSQRTVNIDIKLLNAMLNHAWRYDAIAYNPIAKYPYAKEERAIPRYLKIDEVNLILEEAMRRGFYDIFYCILTLGMRAEEACFLQYSDIIHKTVIHIKPKQTWHIDDSGQKETVSWAPKWNKERRIDFGESYIHDKYLQERLSLGRGDRYCFPRYADTGQPFNRHTLYDIFTRIAKAVKVDDVHVHILRHTHISYMVARIGLDPRVTFPAIMDNVGISDLKTLMGYTKTVKGLANSWSNHQKLPWQK